MRSGVGTGHSYLLYLPSSTTAQLPVLRYPQVVEWVLAPVRAEWASPAWQAHLASPEAFIQQYTPVQPDGAGGWQVRLVLVVRVGCTELSNRQYTHTPCTTGWHGVGVWRLRRACCKPLTGLLQTAYFPRRLARRQAVSITTPTSLALPHLGWQFALVAFLQAGGQAARWILYHHTHLVERCFRTMKAAVPPGSPLHPLTQHAGGQAACLQGKVVFR